MKTLLLTLFVLSTSAFASEVVRCDANEAQIIAEVVSVETDSMMTCKAMISAESVSLFNEHSLCRLSLEEVIENGVDFPLVNGHDCEVPSQLNGYLVQKNGEIVLD